MTHDTQPKDRQELPTQHQLWTQQPKLVKGLGTLRLHQGHEKRTKSHTNGSTICGILCVWLVVAPSYHVLRERSHKGGGFGRVIFSGGDPLHFRLS